MRLFVLIVVLIGTVLLHAQINPPLPECFNFSPLPCEINCMSKFDRNTHGYNPVNAFLLAKMNEMMYPERLDLQLRFLQNDRKIPDSIRSTQHLKCYPLVDNSNFRNAFEDRFSSYFADSGNSSAQNETHFYFLEKPRIDTVRIAGIKAYKGYDPEVIIIDDNDLLIILFRGTDDVMSNRWAEWIGTDFSFSKTRTDSVLNYSKIHKGFYRSFELIKPDLLSVIDQLGGKQKKIWLSGHSLGGAMAVISGIYLSSSGYDVVNVYTYAGPRAIGDKNFAKFGNELLGEKIHRFEYYLDPVSILWSPGYTSVGQRYWFDNATKGNYKLYSTLEERHFSKDPFKFRKGILAKGEKKELLRIRRESRCANLSKLPYAFFYHNTQWLVKATYLQIPDSQRKDLPRVDDSFPFIYYGWDQAK